MGRGYTQYAFPDSSADDVYALYSAFLNYRLASGELLHVRQTECWCASCERIDMAERIESLNELEQQLERLRHPDEDESCMIAFIGVPIDKRVTEAEIRIKWRRGRISPPKCLQCGSVDIMELPGTDEFSHPKTGERVVVTGRGFASTDEWHAEFTSEGDVIKSVYK